MTQQTIERMAIESGLANFVEASNPAVLRFVQAMQRETVVLPPGHEFTPTERAPMTYAEIRKWWARDNGLEDCDLCVIDDFVTVVRAVEAIHGIKGAA